MVLTPLFRPVEVAAERLRNSDRVAPLPALARVAGHVVAKRRCSFGSHNPRIAAEYRPAESSRFVDQDLLANRGWPPHGPGSTNSPGGPSGSGWGNVPVSLGHTGRAHRMSLADRAAGRSCGQSEQAGGRLTVGEASRGEARRGRRRRTRQPLPAHLSPSCRPTASSRRATASWPASCHSSSSGTAGPAPRRAASPILPVLCPI